MIESLWGTGRLYSASGRILDALLEAHPLLVGLKKAHGNKAWTNLLFRDATAKLIAAADREPGRVECLLAESLNGADEHLAAAAATALSDERFQRKLVLQRHFGSRN